MKKSSGLLSSSLGKLSEESVDEYGGDRGWVVRAISKLNAITRLHRLRRHDWRVLENESARLVEQNQVLPSLKMKLKTRLLFRPGYWKFSPLTHLSECPANLIRVGDPNQAINSTFTPAGFISVDSAKTAIHQSRLATMDQAGRSTRYHRSR